MKSKLLFLFSLLLFACSNSNEYFKEGVIKIMNGEHNKVKVPYTLWFPSDFSEYFTHDDFKQIVNIASREAKSNCKYKTAYCPKSLGIFHNLDTATIYLIFVTKEDAFGVPVKFNCFTQFKGTILINSFVSDEIKE